MVLLLGERYEIQKKKHGESTDEALQMLGGKCHLEASSASTIILAALRISSSEMVRGGDSLKL